MCTILVFIEAPGIHEAAVAPAAPPAGSLAVILFFCQALGAAVVPAGPFTGTLLAAIVCGVEGTSTPPACCALALALNKAPGSEASMPTVGVGVGGGELEVFVDARAPRLPCVPLTALAKDLSMQCKALSSNGPISANNESLGKAFTASCWCVRVMLLDQDRVRDMVFVKAAMCSIPTWTRKPTA